MYRMTDMTSRTNPITYDKFIDDFNYIKNEIITLLPNGKYMKYSKILKAVTILEFTKEEYIKYWSIRYTRNSKHTIFYDDIVKEAKLKFETGLTPLETMLELVNKSHDETSDKVAALRLLQLK